MAILFTHLRDLLPLIRPYADGCPSFMITQAARLAAVEFCERTRCWREIITVDVRDPETTNIIPIESVIWEIEQATYNGVDLKPVQHSHILRDGAATGAPRYISQSNPWSILVHPFPGGTEPITVELTAFLKPRSDMILAMYDGEPMTDVLDVVPEWMMMQHAERLVDGALARVLMMKGENWYDPNLAAVYQNRFNKALDRNFSANMRGQHRAPIRMPTEYM